MHKAIYFRPHVNHSLFIQTFSLPLFGRLNGCLSLGSSYPYSDFCTKCPKGIVHPNKKPETGITREEFPVYVSWISQ
jgi:hypothetical protein